MSEGKKFIKDISYLSIWNTSSSLINVFSFYIITNLLGPTEYGKYALALSLITTASLAVYASVNDTLLRFSAITNDKRLVKYCLKIQSVLGFFAFMGFLIFSKFVSNVYGKPIGPVLFIIAFSFLFTPVLESIKNFSVGRRKIKNLISLSLLSQVLLISLSLVLFFFNLRTAFYMSVVYILVSFLTFLYAIRIVLNEKYESDGKYNQAEVWAYIKGGFVFGFFKNFYFQSALIIGSRYVDINNVAYFNFSMSIAIASIFAVTNSMLTIIVPYVTSFYDKGQTDRVAKYLSASTKLGLFVSFIIASLLYLFLWLFIDELFPKYTNALQIMPYVFLAFVLLNFNTPIPFLKAKGKLFSLNKSSIITAVFSFINSYFLSKYFGFKGMVLSLIINFASMGILTWYYAYKDLGLKFTIIPSKEELSIFKIYFVLLVSKFLLKFKNFFR